MSDQAGSNGSDLSVSADDVTRLLLEWNADDPTALNRLFSQVFHELRRIAQHLLQGERASHTLEPSALVHELYIRLADQRKVEWDSRRQFFSFAAQLMRLILVDHARRRQTSKRGSGVEPIALDDVIEMGERRDLNLVRLDEALKDLAAIGPRQSQVVELRFFAGLSVDEIGELTGYSRATVLRDWRHAKLWLFRQLQASDRSCEEEKSRKLAM
ncbi:MAG: ECF-type sigma factor [Acidobacteriota bacterium]